MTIRFPIFILCVLALGAIAGFVPLSADEPTQNPSGLGSTPWSLEKASEWHARQPWLVGCNFVPSTAVNDVEMWQAATYDPRTIDRELGYAQNLGFNSVRVFLNFVVWKADADGLKKRLDDFLGIAARHHISVMLVLLDDCNFANRPAAAGPQPPPVPGEANGQWVSSPPLAMVTDPRTWSEVKRYVQDIVGTLSHDPRVVIWDVYNEAGNSHLGDKSLPLVKAAFAWAREAAPMQPLTSCVWLPIESPFSQHIMALSDIVSFHCYDTPINFRAQIRDLRKARRPLVCTEWLHRPRGNTIAAILPLLREERIGSYNWGLVAGRTQTFMPWGSKPGAPEPKIWQHDLLHADGTPFDPVEARLIQKTAATAPAARHP